MGWPGDFTYKSGSLIQSYTLSNINSQTLFGISYINYYLDNTITNGGWSSNIGNRLPMIMKIKANFPTIEKNLGSYIYLFFDST